MASPRTKNKLGQYFTPQNICDLMVRMSNSPKSGSVLEPSSGTGAFLDALDRAGFENVFGVEIDPNLAHHSKYQVDCSSFITWSSEAKFDLIIGNPPYIRWKDLEEEQKLELTGHRLFGEMVNSLSDYLLPFIALSIEKLKPGGELIFITPSFWLQTKHSSALRRFLDLNGQITDLVDFGEERVFKDVATSLVIFKFVKSSEITPVTLHRFVGRKVINRPLDLSDEESFRSEPVTHFHFNGKYIPAFDAEVRGPLALEAECTRNGQVRRLGSFVRIANGMVTGLDSAFKLHPEHLASIPEDELIGVSKVLKGKDLDRFFSSKFSHYIDIEPSLKSEDVYERFPTLIGLLAPFREELQKRYVNGSCLEWWQWSFYRSSKFHRSDEMKGFVPGKERLSHKPHVRFSISKDKVVATQDVTAFAPLPETKESLHYIVAYLCLPVISDWVRVFGLMKGGVAEFSEKPLSELPFRQINWDDAREVLIHEEISNLAGKVSDYGFTSEEDFRLIAQEFEKLMPRLAWSA